MTTTGQTLEDKAAYEARWVHEMVRDILEEAPVRRPTSEDERRAHLFVERAYRAAGIEAQLEGFAFNENLYATIALHFGLAVAGSIVGDRRPGLAFALHALSAGSYALDSSRKAFVLRRLF